MNRNLWLGRLALMGLCLVFGACTELSPSSNSEYVVNAPGSTCLPGDIDAHNPCAPASGCNVTDQYCDPSTGTWTQCGTYDICALGVPGSTIVDGGSCTDGAYRFCSVGGSGGALGTMTCSGGIYGPCTATMSFDAGVFGGDASVTCGGDPLIGSACSVGLGACAASGTYTCNASGMRVCSAVALSPTTEVCDNVDNDCNGIVDDFVTRSCYGGPAGTASVGICRYGTQTCTAGSWGTTCVGEVDPAAEIPDDGIDQDCNGADLGSVSCGSDPRVGRPCSIGLGVCINSGTFVCDTATNVVSCSAAALPAQTETCDGLDNDCDGVTDDGVMRSCYGGPAGTDGIGICHHGTQVCIVGGTGMWDACVGEQDPLLEIPDNGIDEDCSGSDLTSVMCSGDMSVGMPCATGIGSCRAMGSLVCSGGLLRCDAVALPPTSETCNNVDDDCDTFIDDAVVQSCYSGPAGTAGVGLCHPGSQTCTAGTFSACSGEVLPTAEIPDNGIDEDCSGGDLHSATCGMDPSLGSACSVGIGACLRSGTIGCASMSLTCSATAGTSSTETCNGVDDDCNGVVDNGTNVACYTGTAGTAGVGICRAGVQICSGGSLTGCSGQVTPGVEICGDGIDQDCNGSDLACAPPPPVDAGTDSGPIMSDAGVDSGPIPSDAGTDSGPVGSDSGTSTSEATDRANCRAARFGSHTMTITYNQATLNALFGTCASGWVTILYDQNGCENPSDPGASSLTIDLLTRSGGQYVTGLRCGTTYRSWPVGDRNHVVNTDGVSSIVFDTDELADSESHFCPDLGPGTSLLPRVPAFPGASVSCP